jgi:threonine aldolase
MKIVDLRSDTVTRPTAAMRAAMASAAVGDDVFGDDPTVLALQQEVARLLGKEAALFVPSGTMANQLAVRVHGAAGEEAIVHAACHIYNYEGGAAAALSGVQLRPIDSADGTLDLDVLERSIRGGHDPHLAPTRLVCLENTHNACGGLVVPQGHVTAVAALARRYGLALHLDGARLANAAVASGASMAELAEPFDTVSLCLSKGLGAPVGSVLAGPQRLVDKARHWRKRFGGGMRQAGILAAAGLYALHHHVARLSDDHRRARHLAEGIAAIDGLTVDLSRVHTNLVFFEVDTGHPLARHGEGGQAALVERMAAAGVLLTGGPYRLRAVTHLDVDDDAMEHALRQLHVAMRG